MRYIENSHCLRAMLESQRYPSPYEYDALGLEYCKTDMHESRNESKERALKCTKYRK